MVIQLFLLVHTVLFYNTPVKEILSFLEIPSDILKKKTNQQQTNCTDCSLSLSSFQLLWVPCALLF